VSLDASINLDRQLPLMQDEERASIAILLHQILSFQNFTQFEFLQQHFLELGVLDEG
jgi:hypothetical protein